MTLNFKYSWQMVTAHCSLWTLVVRVLFITYYARHCSLCKRPYPWRHIGL